MVFVSGKCNKGESSLRLGISRSLILLKSSFGAGSATGKRSSGKTRDGIVNGGFWCRICDDCRLFVALGTCVCSLEACCCCSNKGKTVIGGFGSVLGSV